MLQLRQKTLDRHGGFTLHAAHQTQMDAQSTESDHPGERQKEKRIRLYQVPESGKSA